MTMATPMATPGEKIPEARVLVVDDEANIVELLSVSLKFQGFEVATASNGAQALDRAREARPDAVILDVMMPGMDGFETCAKIRETALNRATPVVFVTSLGDFDVRAKAGSNGGDDLMGKPFLTSEINVKALTFALRGRLQELISRQIEVAG